MWQVQVYVTGDNERGEGQRKNMGIKRSLSMYASWGLYHSARNGEMVENVAVCGRGQKKVESLDKRGWKREG